MALERSDHTSSPHARILGPLDRDRQAGSFGTAASAAPVASFHGDSPDTYVSFHKARTVDT